MDEISINVQQLPVTMLETIVLYLNMDEQVVLANVSRYFYLIVSPILYKDILFRFYSVEFCKDEATEEYNQALEVAMTEFGIDDELDYVTKKAEIGRDLYKEKVVNKLYEYRQKLWFELEPAIKKHHKFINGSRCINPNNLIAELECYSNLKRYKLTIDTQQGMDQLKSCIGDKFKSMKMLELSIESGLNYDVEDFYQHLIHLEALDINMNLFHNDLKRFSGFSSNTLNYLSIDSLEEVLTDLLYIIHRNFKNLNYLSIYLNELSLTPSRAELPTFENLRRFYFSVSNSFNPSLLSYLNNAKYWPKLEIFRGYNYFFDGIVQFEGQWNNLTTLTAYNIDPTNLNQWNNFSQLQFLELKLYPTTDSKMLKTIFTNLTKLIAFKLYGDISSHHFDFVPHIQLRSLYILSLDDFSQPFVNFLKALVTIKKLRLYFSDNAFDGVNLNILLEEKHKFPNLREVLMENLPEQLQKWFLHSLYATTFMFQ